MRGGSVLRAAAVGLSCLLWTSGCRERYRVGDRVLVAWCEGEYPAFVISRKGPARYRVHFEGYAERWDSDVGVEEVKRRLEEPLEVEPPLCPRVAAALGMKATADEGEDVISPYEEGAKIFVTWRGAVYKAIITEVIDRDHLRIHYEGHESAWDEVISPERIVKGQ
jgi:hypothetical protein